MAHSRPFARFTSLLAILIGSATTCLPRKALAQASATTTAPADPRIEELRRQLDETRRELAEIQAKLKAAGESAATAAAIADINLKIDAITRQIEVLQLGEAVAAPSKSGFHYGLGPAASKIYAAKPGVSVGGYGEVIYENFAKSRQDGSPSHETDLFDLQRAVLYFGYKFDDHFVFNSELEYEHAVTASDKEGEGEIEFAYIDYLHRPAFNIRAGLILIPVGLTNQMHEPTTFLGARRPDVEQRIIPTTWRELGAGVYGDTGTVAYQAYVVNGLDSSRYAADGIGEGSSEGSLARAQNFALTGRLDFTGVPGLLAGASFFTGDSGQGQVTPDGRTFGGRTTLWDAHALYQSHGLDLRALYAHTSVGDATQINELDNYAGAESVGSRQSGWYVSAGYDVFSLMSDTKMALLPFARYEEFDTQGAVPSGYARDPENHVHELTIGAVFKPIDRIAIKADWQQIHNAAQTGVNQWNLLLGYLF